MALQRKCLLAVYICLCFSQPHCVHSKSSRIQRISSLIQDVMANDDQHSSLWLKTCWPKTENLHFLKSTRRSYKLLQHALEADVSWDESEHFHHVWLAVDMHCEESVRFVVNTSGTYFGHPFRWILVDGTDDVYGRLHLLPDNNVILAAFDDGSDQYDLRQGELLFIGFIRSFSLGILHSSLVRSPNCSAYRISKGRPLIFEVYGSWSEETGLVDSRQTRILSKRRRNLQGQQLVAAGVFMKADSVNHIDLDDYRWAD